MQGQALGEAVGLGWQAESALDKGEVWFRRLLEKLPAAAYTCDAEGLITYFNPSAVTLWGRMVEAAGHRLALTLPNEPLVLDADPVRLAQVFSNLLNNAARYTEPGGQIRLAARRDGVHVVVAIRDTGVGIPADMLPRVFEMFTQWNASLHRAQGGLGIGLSLARSLVQMHAGSLEARSDGPGQGSEFVVRLPLAAQVRLACPACPAALGGAALPALAGGRERPTGLISGRPGSGEGEAPSPGDEPRPACPAALSGAGLPMRRILAVDDNRDAADTVGMLLEILGADARVAYDGPSALEAIRADRPAVVLLDIGMPDMDGHEVARRIRQDPELRDVTLVAMTGWGQDEDRQRSRAAGFDHHLVKPVRLEVLEALLLSLESHTGSRLMKR